MIVEYRLNLLYKKKTINIHLIKISKKIYGFDQFNHILVYIDTTILIVYNIIFFKMLKPTVLYIEINQLYLASHIPYISMVCIWY